MASGGGSASRSQLCGGSRARRCRTQHAVALAGPVVPPGLFHGAVGSRQCPPAPTWAAQCWGAVATLLEQELSPSLGLRAAEQKPPSASVTLKMTPKNPRSGARCLSERWLGLGAELGTVIQPWEQQMKSQFLKTFR